MVICQMCDLVVMYSTEYTYLIYLARGSKAQSETCRMGKKDQATQKIFDSANANKNEEWEPFLKLHNNLHDKNIVLLHITHGYFILQ